MPAQPGENPASLPAYAAFAIDLDGVVWLSRDPIEGSIDALNRLGAEGRTLAFVTNDPRSDQSRARRQADGARRLDGCRAHPDFGLAAAQAIAARAPVPTALDRHRVVGPRARGPG